ncbi:type II toxin-antitoxin system RelE/ParE family toxin [Polaribacter glomeratus]|uniref:Plasmid stabilization protein n=1 Tax=Polaribacter glomeratus TaxID=102 RepID=A0A2S7WH25_9FLAO|nr:type II toxin-antitoxin system RelE/ParE family toxin [Polaribacter glomeratus]PQJ76905.1 hypothetical protein BTO16_13650 [Polaribacter glomeratus]TXD67249.1 type II toxin-antitoxin system RelE/ParE family toxin [Polaribacter glomeratus]
MRIKVEWSEKATSDLQVIFENVKELTFSEKTAFNVVNDIYEAGFNINFVNQYQIDEFLGDPYRRMIIRDYKIIYIILSQKHIKILQIFNTFQSPSKLRK